MERNGSHYQSIKSAAKKATSRKKNQQGRSTICSQKRSYKDIV
jgi:hypothetical protein